MQKLSTRKLSEAFGLKSESLKRDTTFPVYAAKEGSTGWECHIPTEKMHHFTQDVVNDLREFEYSGYRDGCLFITGPKGAGKSSTVEQFYARLEKPVFRATGHERLEVSDLIGTMSLRDGKTEFQYGPLTLAALNGGVFLFDEADACPPEVLVGLHGILEMGDRFVIPENGGEVINIEAGFRVIVTGNTAGSGDSDGQYAGTVIQNSATLDRFNFLLWDYPSEEVETGIVMTAVPQLQKATTLAQALVKAARATRGAGVEEISTRTLIRWARKVVVFKEAQKPLVYSLDRAFSNRLSESKRAEVYAIMKTCFGSMEFFGTDA